MGPSMCHSRCGKLAPSSSAVSTTRMSRDRSPTTVVVIIGKGHDRAEDGDRGRSLSPGTSSGAMATSGTVCDRATNGSSTAASGRECAIRMPTGMATATAMRAPSRAAEIVGERYRRHSAGQLRDHAGSHVLRTRQVERSDESAGCDRPPGGEQQGGGDSCRDPTTGARSGPRGVGGPQAGCLRVASSWWSSTPSFLQARGARERQARRHSCAHAAARRVPPIQTFTVGPGIAPSQPGLAEA